MLDENRYLERDAKKWEPVFVIKFRDNKNLERTFDPIKCHRGLIKLEQIVPIPLGPISPLVDNGFCISFAVTHRPNNQGRHMAGPLRVRAIYGP
jgi:hypothetical protein